jgi:hypothetical protein
MKRFLAACLISPSLLLAASAYGADAINSIENVTVQGKATGEVKRYRDLLAGLDVFEAKHSLAPNAAILRFRLSPMPAAGLQDGASLRIVGRNVSIVVPVAQDGSFVLPRDQAAYDADAELTWNRARGLEGFAPVIKSSGVPNEMQRLGDLRLQCEVSAAIGKKELNFLWRSMVSALIGSDWCNGRRKDIGTVSFDAPAVFESLTLVDGARRKTYRKGPRASTYSIPVNDFSWPDSTLVEFEFSPAPTHAAFLAEPIFLRGSMNNWGTDIRLEASGDKAFRADISLPAGRIEFKLASANFRSVNLGATGNHRDLTIEGGGVLSWEGRRLAYIVDEPGKYRFSLQAEDALAPRLTIERLP